jgi:hypothetical protein
MHGQKKRRKRTVEGSTTVDGIGLSWELISEPQITTEGLKGLCISVRNEAGNHRELILEYPFPRDRGIQVPQRPKFSEKTVEADIRRALASGWDPESRGKTFVFHEPKI